MFSRKIYFILTACICSVLAFDENVRGDSVYAIPQHWGAAKLNAYEILENVEAGKLEYRATYDLLRSGAGDVCIDTKSNILFVTFEGWEYVQLINARTFLNGTRISKKTYRAIQKTAGNYSPSCRKNCTFPFAG